MDFFDSLIDFRSFACACWNGGAEDDDDGLIESARRRPELRGGQWSELVGLYTHSDCTGSRPYGAQCTSYYRASNLPLLMPNTAATVAATPSRSSRSLLPSDINVSGLMVAVLRG